MEENSRKYRVGVWKRREVCLGRSQSPSPVSYRHTWRTREVGTDKSALEIDKTSQMYE
jgi:hypothetical protein